MKQPTIKTRVYYTIRFSDVELAENFAARCPEVNNLTELNAFFHTTLSQFPEDTVGLRQYLDDTTDLEEWLRQFKSDILPFMCTSRFPPMTSRAPVSPYCEVAHV